MIFPFILTTTPSLIYAFSPEDLKALHNYFLILASPLSEGEEQAEGSRDTLFSQGKSPGVGHNRPEPDSESIFSSVLNQSGDVQLF